jgi:hypothetical protein
MYLAGLGFVFHSDVISETFFYLFHDFVSDSLNFHITSQTFTVIWLKGVACTLTFLAWSLIEPINKIRNEDGFRVWLNWILNLYLSRLSFGLYVM